MDTHKKQLGRYVNYSNTDFVFKTPTATIYEVARKAKCSHYVTKEVADNSLQLPIVLQTKGVIFNVQHKR